MRMSQYAYVVAYAAMPIFSWSADSGADVLIHFELHSVAAFSGECGPSSGIDYSRVDED